MGLVHGVVHEEGVGLGLGRTLGQGHRFGRSGGFIQQRGVGDLHAGQVGAQGLEVDQRFHAALRDLGLVRGVSGVPRRVFQHVAQDDVRGEGAVVPLADEGAEHLVPVGDGADLGQCFHFGQRAGQRQCGRRLDARRHDGVGQCVQRGVADHVEHLRDFGVVGADVAFNERVVVFKLAQGRGVLGHGWHPKEWARTFGSADGACHGRQRSTGPCGLPGCPSVLLPESLKARGCVLRAPSAPALAGLSRVLVRVVSGLSDYGRCAFGSGCFKSKRRFSHHVAQRL